MADSLSTLIQNAVMERRAEADHNLSYRVGGVTLVVCDDTLLFFKAASHQAIIVWHAIACYAMSMNQLTNPANFSLLFGDSCPQDLRLEVKTILNVMQAFFEAKYLGLPVPDGRMNRGNSSHFRQR